MNRCLRTSVTSILLGILLVMISVSCSGGKNPGKQTERILTVFHAGSLSVPIKNLAEEYMHLNPGVSIKTEAAGSLACIRKITELGQMCDVLAVADYSLIDDLMIPGHASWNILFATNELTIAYSGRSRRAAEINEHNWYRIIMDENVAYGRSDPGSDPCGYRTILCLQLADKFYQGGIDWMSILKKDKRFIRSKETDLNALLETGAVDYIFTYRSVAMQHGFRYLSLPDSLNLSRPGLDSWYSGVSVEIPGEEPGKRILKKGGSVYYSLTIPTHAENPGLAERFVRFILDPGKGGKIITGSGQTFIEPFFSNGSREKSGLF